MQIHFHLWLSNTPPSHTLAFWQHCVVVLFRSILSCEPGQTAVCASSPSCSSCLSLASKSSEEILSAALLLLYFASGLPQEEALNTSFTSSVSSVLECFVKGSSAFFSSLHHVVPSHLASLSVCALHPPPASVFPSERVGSQTKRVSTGLERGIISALLPLLSPSLFIPASFSTSLNAPPLHKPFFTILFNTSSVILFWLQSSIGFLASCDTNSQTCPDVVETHDQHVMKRSDKDTEQIQGRWQKLRGDGRIVMYKWN